MPQITIFGAVIAIPVAALGSERWCRRKEPLARHVRRPAAVGLVAATPTTAYAAFTFTPRAQTIAGFVAD